jgi:hypothetical protein
MLGIWLYGFMTGTRSSRKLEAACRDQIPYLWLTGFQHPDHNSLWRFYKAHRKEMRHLFKLTVKTAVNMNLIDLAVQAIDGTKIHGNAAKERTYDQKGLEKLLERTEKVIKELEKENQEGHDPVPVHLPKKLRQQKNLKSEIQAALAKLQDEENSREINLTDEDTKIMRTRQGIIAGYNMEAAVSPLKASESNKSGMLITATEVVIDPVDYQQLIPMIDQSRENCGQAAEASLADAGFHTGANLRECEQRRQVIVMPESQDKALHNPYHKDKFIYDPATDCYLCPRQQILRFVKNKPARHMLNRIYRGNCAVCRRCTAFGICTTNKRNGRELQVSEYEVELRQHREWMRSAEAKTLYRLRKEVVEPVFGIIKERMGIRRFLLRGLHNVQAEGYLIATAFNLRTLYAVWKARGIASKMNLLAVMEDISCYFRLILSFCLIKACMSSRSVNY